MFEGFLRQTGQGAKKHSPSTASKQPDPAEVWCLSQGLSEASTGKQIGPFCCVNSRCVVSEQSSLCCVLPYCAGAGLCYRNGQVAHDLGRWFVVSCTAAVWWVDTHNYRQSPGRTHTAKVSFWKSDYVYGANVEPLGQPYGAECFPLQHLILIDWWKERNASIWSIVTAFRSCPVRVIMTQARPSQQRSTTKVYLLNDQEPSKWWGKITPFSKEMSEIGFKQKGWHQLSKHCKCAVKVIPHVLVEFNSLDMHN